MLTLTVRIAYSDCPAGYYCDNTQPGGIRVCSVPGPGTYNGSFSGPFTGTTSKHNWTLATSGSYVNFTTSILGEENDNLNLYVYLPNGSIISSAGPGSSKAISVCSAAGTYRTIVEAWSIPDSCAPYNITFNTISVGCCQNSDCNDAKDCSLDVCSSGGCLHCTQAGYNVSTCNSYPCCSGLQQCFDGVCRVACPDFNISLSTTSLSITVPQSGYNSSKSTINVSSINSFNSPVTFSGSWVGSSPTGVIFYFTPNSVTPPTNGNAYANVTINVSSTASTGTYTLRINATSGFLSKYADLTVNILPSPAAPFDFNVTVSPSSGSVVQGGWVNTTVTVTLTSGSPQTVTLSVSGLPSDTTYVFLPSSSGTPTFSRTLNISTSYSTPNGTYSIMIIGTSGSLTKTATYTLTVNPYPFCVRANPYVGISPTYGYGRAGQTLTYTVTVINKDSTACGESTFSLAGIVPSGFSYSFSQPTLVVKPVGFSNSNSSYFYVTSNCNSTDSNPYYPIRVNATNTNAPNYFALSTTSYYYVSQHFSISLSPSSKSGISGSTLSYNIQLTNNKWTTCPATTFTFKGNVPAGWSYTITPQVTLSSGSTTTAPTFNITSPCTAAPGNYSINVTANDTLTGIARTSSSGNYTVISPSCSIQATPFFSTGPFFSTLTATFYNLNTTCFPIATLNCGQGTYVNLPITGGQGSTTCSYPAVGTITYYTARANVSANTNVVCQTTVVDNPNVFNFSVSVSPTPNYNGLVGFWPFDEGWGISSADKSGYNNNANLGVTNWEYVPKWTLGRFGYGLNFDGVDDYIDCGNSSSLNPTKSITIEAWIYPKDWGENGMGRIVTKYNSYQFYVYSDGSRLSFYFWNVSNIANQAWSNTNSINLNEWQHVAVTYDGQYVKFYVNGIPAGQTTLKAGNLQFTTSNLLIGNRPVLDRTFNGIIDEVRIWNRSLSDQEILLHYQLTKVSQGQKHFANVSTTLLSGSSQLVTLTLAGCPPNTECTLIPNVSNPTYASTLTLSTSAQTPPGTYTLKIRGASSTLTKEMNYTVEVVGICTRSNPSLVINPSSKQGDPGEELSYSVSLENKDSLACPSSMFTIELQPLFNAQDWKFDKASWLPGWQYRRTIIIDNTANPNTLTNYQILVNLDTASLISQGKMNQSCSDIRFTDSDGSLISYWIESDCNSANTKIWVKVPQIPASATKVIYLFYGNSTANPTSNSTAVFGKAVNSTYQRDNYYLGLILTNREWIGGGTNLGITGDDSGASRNLPFSVVVYGASVSAVYLSTNGLLRWDNVADTRYSNSLDTSKKILTAHWDDLYISTSYRSDAGIYEFTGNDAVGQYTGYRWATTYLSSSSTPADFEILLYKNGYIQFNVLQVWSSASPNEYISRGDSTNYIDLTSRWKNKESVLFVPRAYPEPIIKLGITLNPGESTAISLSVNSSATASGGDYKFNITASSATGFTSATGTYSISTVCQGLPDGTCIGELQVCRNGIPQNSCGDAVCNCNENEYNCPNDCTYVYYMLRKDWHLISLPYKRVINITVDGCGAKNLSFFYYENYTWKKIVGIMNIKGGYGYWVNPSWFTKAQYCTINITVDRSANISLGDIPKLKKGFNGIGATYEDADVSSLKCVDDLGNQVPIRVVYYWDVSDPFAPPQWKVATSIKQVPPWYYGYWIYVDEDCKLTK